jgi:hypothetical protein
MSAATLRVLSNDRRYIDMPAKRIEIDCPHAVIGVSRLGADGVSDDDAVRLALWRHHREEHCRCTRKLWRQYFKAPWPEVPLTFARAVERN